MCHDRGISVDHRMIAAVWSKLQTIFEKTLGSREHFDPAEEAAENEALLLDNSFIKKNIVRYGL